MDWQGYFTREFGKNLKAFSGLKKAIQKKADSILIDPFYNTEKLGKGKWADLTGLRSKRVNRNVRIIFLICKETPHPYCNGNDEMIIFLAVGPHDESYGKR